MVAFAHLGVVGDGLHFHLFCYSKHLKMFSVKYFTVKCFTCKIFYIETNGAFMA